MNEKNIKRLVNQTVSKLNSRFDKNVNAVFVKGKRDNFYTQNGETLGYSDSKLRNTGGMVIHKRPDRMYLFIDVVKDKSPEFIHKLVLHEFNHNFTLLNELDMDKEQMEVYANKWMVTGV